MQLCVSHLEAFFFLLGIQRNMLDGQKEEDSWEVSAHDLRYKIHSTPLEISSIFVDPIVHHLTHHCTKLVHPTNF